MREITPSFANKVSNSVPEFFNTEYPLFIKFFEYYYQWKNRNGGFNDKDFEYFENSLGLSKDIKEDLIELIRLSNTKSPDQFRHEFADEYLLERHAKIVETNVEEIFLTADDEIWEAPIRNEVVIADAIKQQGGFYVRDPISLNNTDGILLERLMPHINHIKGTADATRLFFLIFFGEDIKKNIDENGQWMSYPITETIAIDYDLIIDGIGSIRDDILYNEYSYVINTKHAQEYYEPLFSTIYMKYIHPSGFGAFIKKA